MLTTTQFETAYRDWSDAMVRFAGGILRNNADGEDAAQIMWLEAWRSRETFDGTRSIGAWLKTILKRVCWRVMHPKRQAVDTVPESSVADAVASIADDADVEADLDRKAIQASTEALPTRNMREVVGATFAGLDTAEIAKGRGVTQQAVSKVLRNAIIKLRKHWRIE